MALKRELLVYNFRKSWVFYINGKTFRATYVKKLLINRWVTYLSCHEVYPNHEILRHYWDNVTDDSD